MIRTTRPLDECVPERKPAVEKRPAVTLSTAWPSGVFEGEQLSFSSKSAAACGPPVR